MTAACQPRAARRRTCAACQGRPCPCSNRSSSLWFFPLHVTSHILPRVRFPVLLLGDCGPLEPGGTGQEEPLRRLLARAARTHGVVGGGWLCSLGCTRLWLSP